MSVPRLPDFVTIGAMKAATTTLHDQLAQQPGLFMSEPKEPNFFSNDEVYARGIDWYGSLFASAPAGTLCGESSTHYTKLPTYPQTVERMHRHLPDAKLIYVLRHPIDRLVSQFVHEWTERAVPSDINEAVRSVPRLTDYSRYFYQLEPYLDAYGPERILPVFFERLTVQPQAELERVCRFLGYTRQPAWSEELHRRNASQQRLRRSALRDAIVWNPAVTWVRRRMIPQGFRDWVKSLWQFRRRAELAPEVRAELEQIFDTDMAALSEVLDPGTRLTCANFKQLATNACCSFRAPEMAVTR